MKNKKILYLFMSVWMLLATSASAALAVCHAPCCRPGAKVEESKDHNCCNTLASSEKEAAAFFSEDYAAPTASLSAEGYCHVKASDNCVAQLQKGVEYVPHSVTITIDAPGEAVSPTQTALFNHSGFLQSRPLPTASTPGGGSASIIVKNSSFLC